MPITACQFSCRKAWSGSLLNLSNHVVKSKVLVDIAVGLSSSQLGLSEFQACIAIPLFGSSLLTDILCSDSHFCRDSWFSYVELVAIGTWNLIGSLLLVLSSALFWTLTNCYLSMVVDLKTVQVVLHI